MVRALVIAEHDESTLASATRSAIAAACALEPDSLDVAVLAQDGGRIAATAARIAGVTGVIVLEREENAPCLATIWAPQIAAAAAGYTHVLAAGTTTGRDLMPRVAALLGAGMLSDITAVESASRFRRPIYAGNAIVRVEADPASRLCVTVRATAFEAAGDAADAAGAAPIERLGLEPALPTGTRFIEQRSGRQSGPALETARRVVAGGRGLAGAEGFGLVEALAEALGAAVGASRAAVDSGWAPNELQVGQTGKIVAPELYIAVGISGAIQHLTGIRDAGTIVAINSDADAPICAVADLVLNADLFETVPALIEALRARGDLISP